jgi:GNAT superfamily N-acetyltransferase
VRIRPALADDREFVLGLADRLTEFGGVPGRDRTQMIARDRAVLAHAMDTPSAGTAIFIADDEGQRLGFVHLTTADDYYSGSLTGHVADIVVTAAAAGRGVGSALLEHAEAWARERGFAILTLNVFSANRRARDLYARRGFREEWIRCIKRLQP